MNDERRTIADLVTRHELEPGLDDVYVEGSFDKEILDRIFSSRQGPVRTVYEIDTINVPPEVVISHKLTDGNKQRVIALARELALIDDDCSYRCLVDRDLDHWIGAMEQTKRLAWTEFTSIEAYYLNPDFINELIIVLAKCSIDAWPEFLRSMIECLKSLYCIRLAAAEMKLNATLVAYAKSFKRAGSRVVFDEKGYVLKYLQANSAANRIDQFNKILGAWKAKVDGNPQYYVHGHDFVYLICWVVGKFDGVAAYASPDAVQRIFVLLANRVSSIAEALD